MYVKHWQTMDNKYVNRAKISEAKFRELVRLFALDLTATQMAELTRLNRNTVNRYIKGIRQRIAEYCNAVAPLMKTTGKVNGDRTKTSWLGICEKEKAVYTLLLNEGYTRRELKKMNEIDVFIDLNKEEEYWIKEPRKLRKINPTKVNCINGFRGFIKSRLEKFKGIHSQTYFLHLKESEFRYNNPQPELYHLLLRIIRNNPLF